MMAVAKPKSLPAGGMTTLLRLLFKRGGRGSSTEIVLRHVQHSLDREQIRRYRAMFGFTGEHVPLSWFYLLAQRAHLDAMLLPAFPYRPVGMIHVDNTLEAFIDPDPAVPLHLTTRVEIEPETAGGARHCRLHTEACQHDALVFQCSSRYLARRGARSGKAAHAIDEEHGRSIGNWHVGPAAGRRYAALSGDWNPIHLWPWSARLMGLPAPIIHGMHSVAMSCARLEQANSSLVRRISARFKSTIALGAEVELHVDEGAYRVRCRGRLAVEGEFGLA